MTLAELRVWHWRKVLSYRSTEHTAAANAERWERVHGGRCRYWRNEERKAYTRANWHLSAVQALNDVLPGTAEQDCSMFPEPHSRKKLTPKP